MIAGGTPEQKWLARTTRKRASLDCNGKASFATPGLAQRVMRRDRLKKGPMDIYRCKACGGYHIGRKRK